MKEYKTLLFDIDDTLLDFGAAEHAALQALFAEERMIFTTEIEELYKRINHQLWSALEEGTICRDEVMNTRFAKLFQELGIEADGMLLDQRYRSFLEEGRYFVEGALELIETLHSRFDLYIVTNGDSTTQYNRLKNTGLFPYFKEVFVSEDTGYQKPMKEYFDHVFKRIPNISLDQTLIIGDSMSADIRGGHNAGIDTCWLNPSGIENHLVKPTYEIRKLEELYTILGVSKKTSTVK